MVTKHSELADHSSSDHHNVFRSAVPTAITATGEQTDGTAINGSYTTKYDGKDVPVSGNLPYDTIAVKQVNANTLTDARKKTGGPYKATSRVVVSNGGKTMTTTTKGTNAAGKPLNSTLVFDKQ
jgi:hypothetical protein